MQHKLDFKKMHGAGNDFIMVDDRPMTTPLADQTALEKIALRRTGIGCDGLIFIQPSDKADFRMRFFNPDGREAEMCGNGARCAARFAHDLGAAPADMRIDTMAGMLRSEIQRDQVKLHLTPPTDQRLSLKLDLENGRTLEADFINTGVPHVVVRPNDLAGVDIDVMGAAIRYHPAFRPAGTNANFMTVLGPSAIGVRTYERGVEAETLACGTGMTACALIAGLHGLVTPPVSVTCAGGYLLSVDYPVAKDDTLTSVTLTGPAAYVFEGTIFFEHEA